MCQFCRDSSGLDSRQGQKFLIGLDTLGYKLSVPEQGVCGHRGRHIPRGLPIGDRNHLERNIVRSGYFRYPWHPIIGKWALIGVVEDKPIFRYPWVSGAFPEPRRLCVRGKGQVLERDAAVRGIRKRKPLVSQILWVGKELFFFFSEERIQRPFRPWVFASRIHASSKSLE